MNSVLPKEFLSLMKSQWGSELATELNNALIATEPSVSIRINSHKGSHAELAYERIPWCEKGYVLPLRPAFTFDPFLHMGHYYVQDASSMFLYHLVKHFVQSPVVALDLCAAPGGKSSLLHDALPKGSLVVSNEPINLRAQILAENVVKWGSPYSIVTNNYPSDFSQFTHLFDFILTDVPCSGEGMFRKDEKAVEDWSIQNVELCVNRQHDILQSVWPCLKPGGLLVYSTCTFNHFENEEMVEWIATHLGADVLTAPIDPSWNLVGEYHFFPHKVKGEGQFMAILRKHDEPISAPIRRKNEKRAVRAPHSVPQELRQCLSKGEYVYHSDVNTSYAFPSEYAPLLALLRSSLSLLTYGVKLATMKGNNWQPTQSLAMSIAYNKEAFPMVEVSYDQALAYLRRETISIDAPKGYVMLAFQGNPLGFVKNIGNRANNLYPPEWRIRSGYTTPFCLFQ